MSNRKEKTIDVVINTDGMVRKRKYTERSYKGEESLSSHTNRSQSRPHKRMKKRKSSAAK